MRKTLLLLFVTLLPLMTNASENDYLAEAKQKIASLYKYSNRYEDKLIGDKEMMTSFYDITNPDSLAEYNIKADLKKYAMLVGQGQTGELIIPRELYNPDIEVEIGTDAFYCKSNTTYYKVGARTKTIDFDNDAFSFITNKYGRVSHNDFFYIENPATGSNPYVEIKLLGNIPSASNMAGMELPTQVMSSKYDIMVVMVPDWYRSIAEDEVIFEPVDGEDYVDSASACNKMCFTGIIHYNNHATNGKDARTQKSNVIEYDGIKVDTLLVFEDFEFPYSYKNLSCSYPTLILEGATKTITAKKGFIYSLCIDRVILRSKESGEEIVIAPEPIVTFTEGQMATIILPTTPDVSKGKYYRLDRCEDDNIIFEEELHPQAHVPYIIVPNEDFIIDLSSMDLEGRLRDTVSIKGISFIGSYVREELDNQEDSYIDILDITLDCRSADSDMGKSMIGALRAYLIVSWDDPYHQGGKKGRGEKLGIVLHDNGTGIAEMKNERVKSEKYDDDIYDLSGRKINSQSSILNSQLPKGIYIQNGKVMVK